jgi:hypothetical protein
MAWLFLVFVGMWVFSQTSMGGLVDRILSYSEDKEPKGAGPQGLAFTGGSATVTLGARVKRGDPCVLRVIKEMCNKVGGKWTVISWHRPGAVVAGSGNPSNHRFGRGSHKGAIDIMPSDRNWERADKLASVARADGRSLDVVFRGDADHDPRLGASSPHVHIGVDCGAISVGTGASL